MTVKVSNEQDEYEIDAARLERLGSLVLAAEGADEEAELSVGIVDEERMASLNETYTGAGGPTDVLAFPLDEAEDDVGSDFEEPMLLGDVVICPAVAARQAAEHETTLDDELALLLVHGTLHLLGYDHAERRENEAMREREAQLLERFGVGGRR